MTDPAPAPAPAATPKPRRRRILKIAGLVLSIFAAVMFGRAAVRGSATDPERTTAEGLAPGAVESHLIERDGTKWVQLSSVIDAPIAHVWKIVHDHERMTEFMPRMAHLRVLEDEGDRRKVRIDFHFLFVDRFTEIDVTREVTPERRIERWERAGGSLPVNHGRWVLEPMGENRTFARYEVDARSGMPVPAWLERAILLDALPVVLTRVKERIDELRRSDPAYLDSAE